MSILRNLFLIDQILAVFRRLGGRKGQGGGRGPKKPREAEGGGRAERGGGARRDRGRRPPVGGGEDRTEIIGAGMGEGRDRPVALLVGLNGMHKGETVNLFNGENVVGKAWTCDVVLTDDQDKVDDRHAIIDCRPAANRLRDLDSHYGTWLNDAEEPLEADYQLADYGETVQFGSCLFEFQSLTRGRG